MATPRSPLSTPLSHTLVASTIELDNEFEHRMAKAGVGRRFGISIVMWANFLRVVGDGISVGELPAAAGLRRPRMLSTLGGMERWRYVYVGADPDSRRDGWGSARGFRPECVVRPTDAGRAAQEIWPPLFGEIEARWENRFGAGEIGALRGTLEAMTGQLDDALPAYLPIVGSANGMAAEVTTPERAAPGRPALSTLLAQVLLAYTLDFERESDVSLPLSANFVRVLDEAEVDVRELPSVAGVSKEATAMALTSLTRTGHVDRAAKVVSLSAKGRAAAETTRRLHDDLDRRWYERFGAEGLRAALQEVLGDGKRLALGLQPYPEGWRATKQYLARTNAVLADPVGRLPQYPMVLHRGGWPDGS